MLSLQIGDYDNQVVIDCDTMNITLLKHFLESKTLILQNAKFDLKFLFNYGIFPRKILDTYLQEEVLNMGRKDIRKSLDVLAQRYLKIVLSKEIRGKIFKEGLSDRVIKYGAKDVEVLFPISMRQRKRLQEDNLLTAAKIENNFVVALAYIEWCGIYLDKGKWQAKMDKDNKNLQQSIKTLDDWIKNNLPTSSWIEPQLDLFSSEQKIRINWNSSKQVIQLFKELGIDTSTLDDKGEPSDSVEESIIAPQRDKFEIIKPYLQYKGYAKTTSTYGENFLHQINDKTGRIHTSFRQLMDTGRLSSGDKQTGGVNLQNIPSDDATRHCFTNQLINSTLINADYSGQEQIILANFSKEKNIIDFYKKGLGDMHSFIAQKIYPELEQLPLSDIKKNHADKRQNAKAGGFAINYGGQGLTIATNLGITEEEGDNIYNAYFKAFPDLKQWFRASQLDTLDRGYVLINSITKRRSYIPFFEEFKSLELTVNKFGFWAKYREQKAKDSDDFYKYYKPLIKKYFKYKGIIERRALNYRIQGTGAETLKIACVLFMNWILDSQLQGVVLISNIVHDELLVECPIYMQEEVSIKLKEFMEAAGDVYCKTVKLKAVPCKTNVWGH